MDLLRSFEAGNLRALSRVISLIENRDEGSREILGALYRHDMRSLRIGVTGPPGAGKSTIVNALTHLYLQRGQKVGIVAVDPSSPFTGGALLGDRVRLSEFPSDGSVYFRSMATRGASGGLAAATGNVAMTLDAFGFDVVLIETVGVGQVELDVANACDVVVVVLVPESGDAVQTMKAGLTEIANVFAINKADRPGADRLVSEMQQALELMPPSDQNWEVPVVATEAINKVNVDVLLAKIHEFVDMAKVSGRFERHRRSQILKQLLGYIRSLFDREFIDPVIDQADLEEALGRIYRGESDPYEVGEELFERLIRSR